MESGWKSVRILDGYSRGHVEVGQLLFEHGARKENRRTWQAEVASTVLNNWKIDSADDGHSAFTTIGNSLHPVSGEIQITG